MKITDLLKKESISLKAAPTNKAECLAMAISLMEKAGNISDYKAYKEQVFFRETEGTTGIGDGIAIPHGKCDAVKSPGLAAMVIPGGVEYEALDGEPVDLLFLIAAPNTKDNVHLDVLAKLSRLLMHDDFVKSLKSASSPEEFLAICDKYDVEEAAPAQAAAPVSAGAGKKILAVTACPTGIAHTYMAAEAIQKAAEAKGCWVKVETRGSSGAKNVITAQEIADADGVILAVDTKVPTDRFNGKKVITCQVSDGISKADQLVDRIISGDAPVFTAENAAAAEASSSGGDSLGHKAYMDLMNGVSHMLPFVVGGGILIALAFLVDGLAGAPQDGNFGSFTPVAATLKGIGGVAFGFMLPVLAGYIAESIGDRPALAVGFVGGMIAANGKSGFLGALVAGFLAGYIIQVLKKVTDKLPDAIEKIAPVLIFPLFGILIIGLGMNFIIEPIVGAINTGLNNGLASMGGSSKLLLGAIVGGMMAIDMGGPFNKAAYLFGTASIASGNYDIMAAVMIGGMTPPCAIALSTLLSKNKWTKTERDNGPVNFIMGLSFITEGAIPYAAADPARVIPSCVIGSAAAGLCSELFGCTLMAPHGGIFVFPVVGNPIMYLASLVVGTLVSFFMLALLKKDVAE
ncbi:MAG: PTS sugar transporter subunit IIA [Lachnospiraceae bacterium]|nr:PTS sugar transporter subunit IIA [Lachnospiraceae bacterium]